MIVLGLSLMSLILTNGIDLLTNEIELKLLVGGIIILVVVAS